ncbi:hypothetical protein [Pediococcus inopinatus]|uniref:hypothetical protein n=1 Tax=Pediococcus inopinatus TaxID=114090 RepID=UPI0007C57813|nr:hypothetical protein [Pediococcus inopinatus]
MAYMNKPQYDAVMFDSQFKESKGVKLFIQRAAHFQRIKRKLEEAQKGDPMNPVLFKHIERMDYERVHMVWQAIWNAELEKQQGWKFVEDGEKYIQTLLIEHEGNLTTCNAIEQANMGWIELLDEMKRRQNKGDWS